MPKRRDIDDLQHEIQEVFSELWQVPRLAGLRRGFRPHVDCFRTEDPPALTVVVELPGVDPAEVQLVISERTLVVAGVRRRPRCEGQVYQQMEIDYGPFERQVTLGVDVETSEAHATYERGLLTVVLPIAPKPAPGRVTIEVELG